MSSISSLAEKKGWLITSANNFNGFPIVERDNQGFVYALDFGEYIKIGRTKNLAQRMKTLQLNTSNCSAVFPVRVTFSAQPHSNYVKNEAALHKFFKGRRRGKSELFELSLETFLELAPTLTFEKEIAVERDINSFVDELLRQDWEKMTGLPFELYLGYEKAKTPEEKLAAQERILTAQPTIITPQESVPSIHDIKEFDFQKNKIILTDGSVREMTGALSFLKQFRGNKSCSEKHNGGSKPRQTLTLFVLRLVD